MRVVVTLHLVVGEHYDRKAGLRDQRQLVEQDFPEPPGNLVSRTVTYVLDVTLAMLRCDLLVDEQLQPVRRVEDYAGEIVLLVADRPQGSQNRRIVGLPFGASTADVDSPGADLEIEIEGTCDF
ncbi:MAG: hypothetical protein U0835_00280 [Isosphaeraceae bacterium]